VFLNNQGLASVGGGVTILRHLVAEFAVDHAVTVISNDAPGPAPAGVRQIRIEPAPAPTGPGWRLAPLRRAQHLRRSLPEAELRDAEMVVCLDCHFASALRRFRPSRLVYLSLSCIPRMEWFGVRGVQRALAFVQYAVLERSIAAAADLVVVASLAHWKEMREFELLRSIRPLVLHPVFPGASPTPMRPSDPGIITLLCAGRLVAVKNMDAVLDLAVRLRDLPCRFVIAGDGSDGDRLRRRAVTLGLEDRVAFVGAAADMDALFAEADIFLHPSRYESFGIAVFEAMRRGLPVVVASGRCHTAFVEFVRNGIDGFFVDFDRPVEAADTLRRLVVDRALRKKMGRAAHDEAEQLLERNYVAEFRGATEHLLAEAAQ
jgi:glycosyltransferase involved in cell wall biosynthesis